MKYEITGTDQIIETDHLHNLENDEIVRLLQDTNDALVQHLLTRIPTTDSFFNDNEEE